MVQKTGKFRWKMITLYESENSQNPPIRQQKSGEGSFWCISERIFVTQPLFLLSVQHTNFIFWIWALISKMLYVRTMWSRAYVRKIDIHDLRHFFTQKRFPITSKNQLLVVKGCFYVFLSSMIRGPGRGLLTTELTLSRP